MKNCFDDETLTANLLQIDTRGDTPEETKRKQQLLRDYLLRDGLTLGDEDDDLEDDCLSCTRKLMAESAQRNEDSDSSDEAKASFYKNLKRRKRFSESMEKEINKSQS